MKFFMYHNFSLLQVNHQTCGKLSCLIYQNYQFKVIKGFCWKKGNGQFFENLFEFSERFIIYWLKLMSFF